MVEVTQDRPKDLIKQVIQEKIPETREAIVETVESSQLLKYVLISIRNHYMLGFPVLLLRFLCSNSPQMLSWLSPRSVYWLHRSTDWALLAVAALLITEKIYLMMRGVKRPTIPDPSVNFFVRHHWAILTTIILSVFWGRSLTQAFGFKDLHLFNATMDCVLLAVGTMLAVSKGYILINSIESIQSQFNPTVDGRKEKSD